MWNPSLFSISNRFYKTQKKFGHDGIFRGCHHGTGRAQYWHPAVTCNITVTDIKTIEIVAYLLHQTTQNESLGFLIWTSGKDDTDRIIWLVLDAISCFHVTYIPYTNRNEISNADIGNNIIVPYVVAVISLIVRFFFGTRL